MAAIDSLSRDRELLRHISAYCADAAEVVHRAEGFEGFAENRVLQHAAAMCILEIGELAKHLSAEFTEGHPEIPWRAICRMRDLYAHHYHRTDVLQLWQTIARDLPQIMEFIEQTGY